MESFKDKLTRLAHESQVHKKQKEQQEIEAFKEKVKQFIEEENVAEELEKAARDGRRYRNFFQSELKNYIDFDGKKHKNKLIVEAIRKTFVEEFGLATTDVKYNKEDGAIGSFTVGTW